MREESNQDLQRISMSSNFDNDYLMIIEKQNFADDSLAYFGFFLVFCVIIAIGCFGPPLKQRLRRNFVVEKSFSNLQTSISDVSPKMESVELSMYFLSNTVVDSFQTNCTISIETENDIKKAKIHSLSFYPCSNTKQFYSQILYTTKILDFSFISADVSCFNNIPSSALLLEWKFNRISSMLYHLILRVCFPASLLVCILMRIFRVKNKLKATREQIYTSILTVFTILADDPFYLIHLITPNIFWIYLEKMLKSLYYGYVAFYVTSIFMNLSLESDQIFTLKHVLFLVFGMIVFIFTFFNEDVIAYKFRPTYHFPWLNFFIGCIAIVLIAFQLIEHRPEKDSLLRYRWISYFIVIAGFTVVLSATNLLLSIESLQSLLHGTAIEIVAPGGIINLFALVMEYLHACYMASIDHVYQESGEEEEITTQFVPEVDDEQLKHAVDNHLEEGEDIYEA